MLVAAAAASAIVSIVSSLSPPSGNAPSFVIVIPILGYTICQLFVFCFIAIFFPPPRLKVVEFYVYILFPSYFRKTRSFGEGIIGDVGRFWSDLFATLPCPRSAHSIRQVVQECRRRDILTREQVKLGPLFICCFYRLTKLPCVLRHYWPNVWRFRIIYHQVFCGGRWIAQDPEARHGGWRHVPVRRIQ